MTVPPPPINPIISIQPITTVGVSPDTDASGALLGAKHGDVIQGFVVNRDGKQNPILRTPLGDILVKSDIFLKTGSEVQIRVDVQLASRARIITIDGQAPETYVRMTQTQNPRTDMILQSSILSQQRVASAQPANSSGVTDGEPPTLPAVVLRQDNGGLKALLGLPARAGTQPQAQNIAQPAPQANVTSRLPAGSQVQVTIIAGSLPAAVPHASGEAIAQLLAPALAAQPAPTAPQTPQSAAPAVQTQSPQPQGQPAAAIPHSAPNAQPAGQPLAAQPATTGQAPALQLQVAAGSTQSAQTQQASQVASQPLPHVPAAATSNLSATDVQTLLQAATPPHIRAQQLPPALQNPALAAQTLGQEDGPPHQSAQQHLPSSYRPFAGANVIQQQAAPSAAQPAPQTAFLGTAHVPAAPVAQGTPAAPAIPNQPVATTSHTQATAPTPGGELMQVIGHEPDGGTIIKGEHVTLKLFTAKPLPTGTSLTVQLTQPNLPHPVDANIPARLVEFSSLASHWPALEDALTTLSHAVPTAGQQPIAVNTLIPNIGPRLTHEVMLFLSVVRGGDITKLWPTQVVKQLEESRPELLQRLQLDMGNMQQLAQPAQPQQQWAVYLIPMLFGNEAQHMRLFVRSDDASKHKDDGIHNQRFIMEIGLSHLGDMQLDGFVQGGKRPTQFDLVIRTAKTLPDAVEADISRLFSSALETTRLKGRIQFQTGREYFITPATEIGPVQPGDDGDFTLLA